VLISNGQSGKRRQAQLPPQL
jgi:hypothetical protein